MSKSAKQHLDITAVSIRKIFFGVGSIKGSFILGFFALSFGWFTNATYAVLMGDFDFSTLFQLFQQKMIYDVVLMSYPFLLFPILLGTLFVAVKTNLPKVQVKQNQNPKRVRGLILYLSTFQYKPSLDDIQKLEAKLIDEQFAHCLTNNEFRKKQINNSWRMPFEAINYHILELEYIIIISSKETHTALACFKKILQHLLPKHKQLDIRSIDDSSIFSEKYAKGIDFENIADLLEATQQAYDYLKQKVGSSILIDITSGQKTTTIAGAAVALDAGRKFQYVSGDRENDVYHVQAFDVTYSGEE